MNSEDSVAPVTSFTPGRTIPEHTIPAKTIPGTIIPGETVENTQCLQSCTDTLNQCSPY